MVTLLTPVKRAISACVSGTSSCSEARYSAPAAIPTGEFASRIFESFPWATRASARSPTRGSRPSCDANRGPLPERGGEAHPRGQARQLREARSQGAFRPVVAGPLADPAQTVQRRHGPRIDGITFRIPEAVADHRPEALVGRHHGRRRTRS